MQRLPTTNLAMNTSTLPDAILDPEPVNSILNEAAASLKDYYPVFRDMEIADRWAGVIDATPDAVPVIGPVPFDVRLREQKKFSPMAGARYRFSDSSDIHVEFGGGDRKVTMINMAYRFD